MNELFWSGLAEKIDKVFDLIGSSSYDHRRKYPWLTGALGNPNSGIWFVAENPSKTQIERVRDPGGGPMTPEAQWWSSQGDKLFREMLVKYKFKEGSIDSAGGWNCYITNVIKETDYAKRWHSKSQGDRNRIAEIWSSVLAWEFDYSKPKYVVIFGDEAEKLLKYLQSVNLISLPPYEKIYHYSYIGQYPDKHSLRPMHPERVAKYSEDFARIRDTFDNLLIS